MPNSWCSRFDGNLITPIKRSRREISLSWRANRTSSSAPNTIITLSNCARARRRETPYLEMLYIIRALCRWRERVIALNRRGKWRHLFFKHHVINISGDGAIKALDKWGSASCRWWHFVSTANGSNTSSWELMIITSSLAWAAFNLT